MNSDIERLLDETGWQILCELQQNARLSFSELGQRVGLSSPAVTERVRRMEDVGIIKGYHAEVDLAKLGFPITAFTRISVAGTTCSQTTAAVREIPEVLECYRVTGSDSLVVKFVVTSVEHLERLIDRLSGYGQSTTSIVLSAPETRRIITRPEDLFRVEEEQSVL
ncbi:MAG: Lrp/AsnC family transcriptional regulator [Chloroflexota bacterium]|nr:Lrp/AsnC family transcriptional regulator [Chloroflexota bacterium]